MKLDVGKLVNHMTQGSCIPTDSMKSADNYSSLIHSIGTRLYIDSDKTNLAYLVGLLVKVMIYRVDNIRVKRGQGEVWIIICIEIIVIVIISKKCQKQK